MENLNIMNNEEIKNYNRLCAEFLGAKNLGKLGYSDLESYSHDLFIREEWSNKYQNSIETDITVLSSMSFHSDWNWIMAVCIGLGMEFVTTNKEQLIQQIYDKLRSMETNS